MQNERILLNSLLSKLAPLFPRSLSSDPALVATCKADPDVIVGHEFLGVSLDVILNRMQEYNIDFTTIERMEDDEVSLILLRIVVIN